jgi:hypothetical protein
MTDISECEFFLDATALEPPGPFQQAIEILRYLKPGQYLRMLHRRLPHPLFDTCDQLGISHRHFPTRQNTWTILFWRNDDPAAAEHCRQIEP